MSSTKYPAQIIFLYIFVYIIAPTASLYYFCNSPKSQAVSQVTLGGPSCPDRMYVLYRNITQEHNIKTVFKNIIFKHAEKIQFICKKKNKHRHIYRNKWTNACENNLCFLIPLLQIYSSFFGGGGLLHVTIWPWLHIPVPHVFFFVIDTSLHNISPVCLFSLYRK